MSSAVGSAIGAFEWSASAMRSFFTAIPADKLTYQPIAGCNHAIWNLGHIAYSNDGILALLAERAPTLPGEYESLFNAGTTAHAELEAYPASEALLQEYDRVNAAVTAWYREQTTDQLAQPVPARLEALAQDRVQLLSGMAWHVGLHSGQITMIRKALGQPPLYM